MLTSDPKPKTLPRGLDGGANVVSPVPLIRSPQQVCLVLAGFRLVDASMSLVSPCVQQRWPLDRLTS